MKTKTDATGLGKLGCMGGWVHSKCDRNGHGNQKGGDVTNADGDGYPSEQLNPWQKTINLTKRVAFHFISKSLMQHLFQASTGKR